MSQGYRLNSEFLKEPEKQTFQEFTDRTKEKYILDLQIKINATKKLNTLLIFLLAASLSIMLLR